MDTTSILALIGASSGSFSVLVNAINARRASLEAMRPKLNVDLTSDIINEKIVCHLEMMNVGTKPMNIKSMRLYVFDSGFNQQFLLGLANYSTNLFVHDKRILNRVYDIDLDFTYDNLVNVVNQILKYPEDEITETLTKQHFIKLQEYYSGLKAIDHPFTGKSLSLLIRPFFMFEKNIKFYTDLKLMPADTFPQSVDIVLFDPDAYAGGWGKDPFALSDTTYRINWATSPVWTAPNLNSLNSYKQQSDFHDGGTFARRNDKAILSVSPTELGFPETFAPQEKRSVNFEVSEKNLEEFKIRANLWVTSNVSRFLILSRTVTNNYHFTATPRGWNSAIKL